MENQVNVIDEEYHRLHPRSAELAKQQRRLLPDGVAHDTRYLEPFPLFMDRACGARKWDVDGNEYVCLTMGHGALMLGHAHPVVVSAVQEQVARGTHLGFNHELEARWARAIKALMPSIQKMRFHSSGTEATMMALRLARAFTGRRLVVKFTEHFHGWHDQVSVGAQRHTGAGIPACTASEVVVLPVNDADALEKTLASGEVAAVILEPTGGRAGALPITRERLRAIRAATEAADALLILDEIITGFRVSRGGAQVEWGVTPDLTTLGKVVAGGLPGACVGGRAEIIDMIAHRDSEWNRDRRVPHPGTFNASPLTAAAGASGLELIASQPIVERAHTAMTRIRDGLNEVLRSAKVAGFVHGHGSEGFVILGVDYTGELDERCSAPHEQIVAARAAATVPALRKAMLNNGVDVMSGDWLVGSTVLDTAEIDLVITAFDRSIAQLKQLELV